METHQIIELQQIIRNFAGWRRTCAIEHPKDPRNLRAAAALERIASEDPACVPDEKWERILAHRKDRRLAGLVREQAREVCFRTGVDTLPAFVDRLAARVDMAFGR